MSKVASNDKMLSSLKIANVTCKVIYNHSPVDKCKIYDLANCQTNFFPNCPVLSESWQPVCQEFVCVFDGIKDESIAEKMAWYAMRLLRAALNFTVNKLEHLPAGLESAIVFGVLLTLIIAGLIIICIKPQWFEVFFNGFMWFRSKCVSRQGKTGSGKTDQPNDHCLDEVPYDQFGAIETSLNEISPSLPTYFECNPNVAVKPKETIIQIPPTNYRDLI